MKLGYIKELEVYNDWVITTVTYDLAYKKEYIFDYVEEHYVHFFDYCPHLCCQVYHNVM